ncbi:MAG: hypothetical protein H7Z41_20220 [Cytophagales bacterium]|nr:hypothetical protein [Armatimonadota bacterium]
MHQLAAFSMGAIAATARTIPHIVLLLLLLFTSDIRSVVRAQQSQTMIVNNGSYDRRGSVWNCTDFSLADDFVQVAPESMSAIRFWAVDNSQGQNFGNFSGTLSWFIYHSAGNNRPGSVAASGFSSGIVVTDTGETLSGVNRIFQADIPLSDVFLDSGTYWLRIKEGTPESASDGTSVLWLTRDGKSGSSFRFDRNSNNPTEWPSDGGANDLAFQIFRSNADNGDPGSPETPEPGSLALLLMGVLPTVGIVMYRQHQARLASK